VITDLGHPAFAAHDVDATLRFYRILGIEEAFRLHHDDGALMLVYLHVSDERFVEVFPGGPPPDPDRERSFEHICL
jgi:catechol 2,3-dioxygenase-like lactoylglutathione lyase family enzyme